MYLAAAGDEPLFGKAIKEVPRSTKRQLASWRPGRYKALAVSLDAARKFPWATRRARRIGLSLRQAWRQLLQRGPAGELCRGLTVSMFVGTRIERPFLYLALAPSGTARRVSSRPS